MSDKDHKLIRKVIPRVPEKEAEVYFCCNSPHCDLHCSHSGTWGSQDDGIVTCTSMVEYLEMFRAAMQVCHELK